MTFSNYLSLRTGFRANRPYRSEAIRRLVEVGLTVAAKERPQRAKARSSVKRRSNALANWRAPQSTR
jgi:hypothetical protein